VVVASDDGLVIEGSARIGLDVDAIAALGASLVSRIRVAGEEIVAGAPRVMTLDATEGRFIVAAAGDLVLAVVADREAPPGQIRVTAQRVVADLASALEDGD
jgi:predicted regulator of Ras-like GTPase activity (Roadblock/LC7/MglB family)